MAPRNARRDIFTMTNDHGLRVRFLSYGGIITETDVSGPSGGPDTRDHGSAFVR
jgi:hypothetical protein